MSRALSSAVFILLLSLALPSFAQPAPDFTLPGRNGPVRLSDLRGSVVYLDFWASWCTPCRHSFPWMQQMQDRYRAQGLTVLAVNLDKDRSKANEFLAQLGPNFPVAFDPDGGVASEYGLRAMPGSYLIDRQGRIRATHVGFRDVDRQRLEPAIRQLLQGNGSNQLSQK